MGIEEKIRRDVELASMTTLGVGGPARRYAELHSLEELRELAALASEKGWPVHMLGAGSNLLVSDAGADALILRWAPGEIEILSDDDGVRLRVGAGHDWDEFVRHAVEAGWAGIECLSGIPGSVGAAPIQNIGAYGQEIAEVVVAVEACRLPDATTQTLTNEQCDFAYRDSRFKREPGWVVSAVEFRLRPGGMPTVRYAELERALATSGTSPGLAQVRSTVLEIRASKGMVLDRSDPESRSAGSFFTNPIVDSDTLDRVAGCFDETMPHWPAGDAGLHKLSAAWLIERCGIERGQRSGGARVSRKHVLALVNDGDATASDFLALAREIHGTVQQRTGISLRPEPRLLGFSEDELGALSSGRTTS